MPQGVFSVAGSDPAAIMPANGNQSDNLWMDLQVDTTPPTGASYRLWPNYPTLPGAANGGSPGYTLATEFQLAQPAHWTTYGSTPHPAPRRCRLGARSGM